MPTDAEIESNLRNAVRAHYANPGDEDPTVNYFRGVSREQLQLDEDFYRTAEWKARSKEIIHDQFHKSEAEKDNATDALRFEETRKSLKRSSASASPRPRKKSKVQQIQDEEDDEESTALSEPPESEDDFVVDSKPNKKQVVKVDNKTSKPVKSSRSSAPKKTKKSKKRNDSSELSDAPSPEADISADDAAPVAKAEEDDDTSSELSSVIDDPDPPRKKSKVKNGSTKPSSKSSKPSSKSKSSTEPDPNSEEIKRLQGWLVKCGVRKVWGKELKPFESSKAKIAHLRQMLADVGMTGRYSNEKAAQIKEARELAADIEAVQEGNERWGKTSDDDAAENEARPKRRLIRGAQNYAFLSSDGEETD